LQDVDQDREYLKISLVQHVLISKYSQMTTRAVLIQHVVQDRLMKKMALVIHVFTRYHQLTRRNVLHQHVDQDRLHEGMALVQHVLNPP